MCIPSQIVGTVINAVMIFQYVNIALNVKQRYHYMKHLLSEADSTTECDTSRCVFVEDITSSSGNRTFSQTKDY